MKKIIVMIALLLVFMVTIGGAALAADKTQSVSFTEGLDEFYLSDFNQAYSIFSDLLDNEQLEHELKRDILYYQILTTINLKKINETKKLLNSYKKLGYQSGLIYWKLGNLYLNDDHYFDSPFYNEAKNYLEKAEMFGVRSSPFYRDLGTAYQGLGNMDKAASAFAKALSGNENSTDYLNLAILYKNSKQTKKAIEYFEKALKLDPTLEAIYLNLGNLYLELNQFESAISVLKRGIKINPDFAAYYSTMGHVYLQLEDYQAAADAYKKVIELNQHAYQAYYYLGKINIELKDFESAEYYFKEAVKYNQDYALAYIALGDIYLSWGENYKAIARYSTAIEKNPTYPDAHYHLAVGYYKSEMKEAAISELRRTLHLADEHQKARELLNQLEQ